MITSLLAATVAAALPSPVPEAVPAATAAAPQAEPPEIVVTATRRAEPLARVPESVAAFDQAAIDRRGVKSLTDLAGFVPGLRVDLVSDRVIVRGIASSAGAGTTGLYLDDTPIQIRDLGFDADDTQPALFDVGRVEVLRGPQGTLFGAGSEGGAVRYISVEPNLERFEVYARGEASATAHGGAGGEAGAALGGPILPGTLGFRVSAYRRHAPGWIDKVGADGTLKARNVNSSDVESYRAALEWRPTAALAITPSILHQRQDVGDDDRFVEALSDPARGVFRDSSPEYRRKRDRFTLAAVKVDLDLGRAQLVAVGSRFWRDDLSGYDGTAYDLAYYESLPIDPACTDGCAKPPTLLLPTGVNPDAAFYLSPSAVVNRQRIWTGEVRLQSKDAGAATLSWVIGGFFQHQRQQSRETLADPEGDRLFERFFGTTLPDYFGIAAGADGPIPLYEGLYSYINQTDARERQAAAFGEATWRPLPRIALTGGLRYADFRYGFTNFADGPQNYERTEGAGSSHARALTPKAVLAYQPGRGELFYASWTRGFRPGGANAPLPYAACAADFDALGLDGSPASYGVDRVDSLEVGGKNRLLGNRLSLDASLFRMRWTGIQQSVELPSCGLRFTDNLGSARAQGFDLQLNARPLPGVSLDLAVGYTDARYEADARYPGATVATAGRGDSLGGSPWNVAVGGEYVHRRGGRSFYLRGDVRYASRWRRTNDLDPITVSFDPNLRRPDASTDLSVRAGVIVGRTDLSLFAANLLDSAPLLERQHATSDAALYTGRTWRPRTLGITAILR